MGKEYKSASQLMREAEERRASAGLSAGASAKSAEELAIQQERAETEKTKQNINIFQTAIGTLIDTGFNIDKGTLKGIEGIVDFVIGISNAVPVGIDYLCGGDWYEQIRNAIEYDATGKIMGLREDLTSMIYGRTTLDSSLYRQNKAGQMVAEVEQAVGQMLPSVVVSIATMGAAAPEAAASLGTTVQGLAQAASLATLGVSAAGTSTEAAYADGAGFGEGLAYGAVSGAIEVATEKMFGGVSSAIYGKGMLPKVVPTIANKGLVRVGRELLEEGAEEVVSELASPLAKTIYKGGAALDEYSTEDYWKGVGKSFAMGVATSALYTGTVGYGVAKATGGAVGKKEADIQGLLEDAEKLTQKRESTFYSYKYDRDTDAKIGDQLARRYQEISKILVKMDAGERSAAIEKFSLGKAMAEDGQIAADFADKLGIRTQAQNSTGGVNAAPGANLGQYASPGVDASAAEAAASSMGLSVFEGELTGESRANYRDFLKTARNLNRKTGGRFNFVLVNGSGVDGSQVKGAYIRQGDLVLINTDTLADSGKTADALYENWFGVTVEEAMHLANNTDETVRRDAYHALAQLLSEDEELVRSVSRELVKDGYFTEEQVKQFLTADSLTEDEAKAAQVFFDEMFAHMARHELSTKHFFQRLARRDRSALERVFRALKQNMKSTASGKGKTARGLTERAQAAERLFMEAMAEAGFKVTEDGKIIGVNDEEEKEDIEEADIRFSQKNDKPFADNVDSVLTMTDEEALQNKADNNYISVMKQTPAVILENVEGAKNLEVIIRFDAFYLATRKSGVLEGHYHNLGELMKELPRIIADPDAIIRLDNGRLNMFTEMKTEKGNNGIISIEMNTVKDINNENTPYHLVISAFSSKDNYTRNQIRNHGVSVEYKREDLAQVNHQLYEWLATINATSSDNSIAQKEPVVNTSEENNLDARYSKKAAKRDEVTLTPEEAAREDTPFGLAARRMLERDGETGERRVETDIETAGETTDEIGEDVRLNRYDKTWTYGRAEAEKAIDALLETLGGGDGNKYLSRGNLSVKLKIQDRRELTDKMFEALNTATTNEQLRNAAEEIARAVYDKAVVTTVWAQDVGYIKDVTDKLKLYKSFLGRIDMSGIQSNQIDMKVIRRWEKGRKAETKGTLTIDNVKKILEKEGISFREGLSDSAFIVELNREYERHRIAAQAMLNGIQRIIEEPNQDWIDKMTKSVLEVAAKEGKYRSIAEMMASIDKAEHDLDVRKDSVEKLAEKTQEEIISNRLENQAKYIVEGIRHWKSGEFQAAAEKSNSDILKGTLGKLSKIYYRGNLAVDPTKRVMRELHDWYITQEAKDFLGEQFWNQDIAAHMESIAGAQGRLDSENLKKLCDVLQYMKHAIENFHTVEINGKRVDAAPVAKAYREKAMKSGREIKKETWFGRIFRAYIVNYRDPESLARYFDNYVEGGFLTDMLHNLREGELKAEVIEDSMVSQIEEFSKKHKKYFDSLEKRTIRVGSTEIPAGEALDIYLLLKRKQAVIHLMKSGYRYTSGDGMTERESGFMVTDKDTTEQEMMERAETEAAAIFEQMTEADKDFVNLASKIFNEDCKKFKRETDLFMLGFSNVLDDFYIPIRISDKAIKADDGVYQDELDRVSNASFNKSITEGAKNKIVVENLQTVLLRHIRGISKYAGLARTISEFETLVNMNLSGNSGDIVSIATAYEKIWPDEGKLNGGAIKYLKDMISDVQKLSRDAGNTGLMTAMVEKVRGRAAEAVLGLNPKVVATQFSSLFAATSIIPPKYIIQALYTRAKHGEAGDYSDLARLRNKENVAIRAMTLDDRVGAIGEKAMFAIGKTDEFVVHTVWKACKLMVRDQVGASVSQEAVNTQAGQLLTQVIYETQQNAQSTERSRAMRSNSPLEKIVTMFSADAMKVFGRVMDGVGELRARMARHESPARIAESKRKLGRSVSAMVSSAVYYAIISMLFRKFLARDDDDNLKEWSEADILEFLGDMAGSMMGGLPIIKDIYEFLVSGFSPEDMGLGALTDMMEGARSLALVAGKGFTGQATDEEWFSAIRKLMYAGGTVCGIPISNTIKYTRGLVNLFSDDTVYRYDALHAVPAYSSDIAKAVEDGDEEMVRTVVGVMLDRNVGAVTSSPVRRELARLASTGQTVIPQAVGTSITYDGEEYKMNQRERKAFSSVYGQASAEAAQMISMTSYQAMDDKVKAKALKRLYQFYYNTAMEEVLGVDIEGRAQLVSKVIDPLKLALIVAEAGELAADIGADGKPVAGSKKMKVAQYIAKLKLTEAQKFIVYAYLGYSVSGGEQTIRAYVMAQKDLERGEKEELLEMCGGGY